MAFKWVLSDKLPDVPYLTTMEVYTLLTFMMLFLQGMMFWFFADLYAYRCSYQDDAVQSSTTQGYTDWFTGELVSHTNATKDSLFLNVSCKDIHIADRVLLMVECLLMVAKNVWFVVRVFHNQLKTLRTQTKFNNLGGLEEYSCEKELFWIPDKKIQGHRRSKSQRVTVSPGESAKIDQEDQSSSDSSL